jgi:hypothetical protein
MDEPARSESGGSPSANGSDGRDARGRFVSGNRGGPGNPFARQTAALRRAFLAAVTPEDLEAVARAVVQRAREGDMAAAKLLLLYAIGKPTEAVDPDTMDAQEWQLFQQSSATPEQLTAAMGGMPLELACHVVRAARGPLADAKARMLAQTLAQGQSPEETAQQDDAVSEAAGQAAQAPAADRAEANVGQAPERRRAPKTGAGRRAQRVADETEVRDVPGGPGDVPDADAIERLLGKDFAAGGEIALESPEDFRRNLMRDG